jgi:tetratricopeptide (TPR) repeat protein
MQQAVETAASPSERRQRWRQRRVREAGWVAVLLLGSFMAGLTPIADGDVFWHLAAGGEMFRTHALLRSDPFSVSAAHHPWADVHWLFQLGVYAQHALFGLTGLVITKCVLICAGVLSLYAAVRREARPWFVVIVIAALLCARHLLLVRPVIVSLLFLALYFKQLERFRREGRAALLIPLCFLQIVWSNCQGLFALGPALVAAYAIAAGVWARWGEHPRFPFAAESYAAANAYAYFRALVWALVSCVAGACVTPYGVAALGLPLQLFARLVPGTDNPYQQVAENVPPYLLERLAPGQFWHLPWFLALLALGVAVSARRLLLSHALLLSGFVGLALISNRNVLLLYWLMAPIVAMQLAPATRRALLSLRRYPMRVIVRTTEVVVVSALLLIGATAAAREPALGEPVPFRFPVHSAGVIEGIPGEGSIFSADDQGGYLIWRLFPRFHPYIDTRLVLRTAEQFREYLELAENPQRFEAFQARYHFSYVVLPVAYPDRYLKLAAHLYRGTQWKLIFTDGSELLFAPRAAPGNAWELGSSVTTDRVLAAIEQRYRGAERLADAAKIQLATLEIAVGEFEQADRTLSSTSSSEALALKARCRLAAGDIEGARAIGERLVREGDESARNLDLMAVISMRRGELHAAASFLRRALAVDPFDREATGLLSTMEEYRHER